MKIGDIVRISEDSTFSSQNLGVGKIKSITRCNESWFNVEFENGYENGYEVGDLVLVFSDTKSLTEKRLAELLSEYKQKVLQLEQKIKEIGELIFKDYYR